jgi:DNA-directed RNA polymerase specialized sigma24 family protein
VCGCCEIRTTHVAALDFEQLVEDFYMPLYRFALSLSCDSFEAADLTQ